MAASVRAGLAGTPSRVLAGFDPATTPALMVAAMRELAPAETLDQFVTSNDEFLGVLAQLDDTGWTTLAESPAGPSAQPFGMGAQTGFQGPDDGSRHPNQQLRVDMSVP